MKRKSPEKTPVKVIVVMFLVVVLAIGMLFQVWLKVKIQSLATEIDLLKRDTFMMSEQNNHLQAIVTDLSSYERITRFAKRKMGMIFLKQDVIHVDK